MIFNFDKCQCLHLRHGNPSLTYKMRNVDIATAKREKDLGVALNVNFNVSEKCGTAA